MFLLYFLSLGVSGGMAGVFARRMLALAGYVPTFEAGLALACAVAFAFITCQLLYLGLLRLALPWRASTPYLFETLSNASALTITPFLGGIPLLRAVIEPLASAFADQSDRIIGGLDKIEPFVYLGGFAALHVAFKLIALYAITRSQPASRLPAVGWFCAALLGVYASLLSVYLWRGEMVEALKAAPSGLDDYRVGDTFAAARRLREGALFEVNLHNHEGSGLALRWAIAAEERKKEKETIYVTLQFEGAGQSFVVKEIETQPDAWAELRLAAAEIPEGAKSCSLVWTTAKESAWLLRSGLRPTLGEARTALMAGPFFHLPQSAGPEPNLVVLFVEGLGAEHTSGLGYTRDTTPSLQRLSADGVVYSNVFTPAPQVLPAAMTMLTALNPIRHGYLNSRRGPMPKDVRTLPELLRERGYHTAAFTEGEGPDDQDLVFGSGFERGFEHFDVQYPVTTIWRRSTQMGANPVVPAGSSVTLGKAAKWMEAHSSDKLMVFIRLRELRRPQWLRQRYGDGFVSTPAEPRPLDVYDTAVRDVDKQLGAFYDRLREIPGIENTVFVVTSPYGFDFSASWYATPERKLSEPCLRVPVFISMPERPAHLLRDQNGLAGLEDLGAALAALGRVAFPHTVTGSDLLTNMISREPVSMGGIPTELSLRTPQFRLNWQSGIDPFTGEAKGAAAPLYLLDLDWYYKKWRQGDNLTRQSTVAATLVKKAQDYLQRQLAAQNVTLPAAPLEAPSQPATPSISGAPS